jgi:hypothetical protein
MAIVAVNRTKVPNLECIMGGQPQGSERMSVGMNQGIY